MAAQTDNQIKLSDGHTIGYAEYGDLAGRPVMYLHGLPSSRLEMNNPNTIEVAERLHIRLILPDRPGIGLSDFRPYTIAGYPDLVAEFSDKLGLNWFPVMGVSSGGKFVAACAWKISQRLTSATIVSARISRWVMVAIIAQLRKGERRRTDGASVFYARRPWVKMASNTEHA